VKLTAARASRAPRVLVIYKKSAYQIYVRERKHSHIQTLIKAGDPAVAHLMRAHEHHLETLEDARSVLADLGARAVFRHRSDPDRTDAVDLVVTLGGDGTLLWASHQVSKDVPILAINTAPKDSVGFFCAGTKHALHDVLHSALRGKLKATSLARMRVDVNGKTLSKRVLNDVLFAHECPASTSRYVISSGKLREEHKSSGLWVGPAAGSTAAQHSAGGSILPLRSRNLQFVVREPYDARPGKFRLAKGLVRPGETLRVESYMRAGRLFIDGPRDVRAIAMASRIELRLSDDPLTLLGFRGSDRRKS
jgi:NAD+ kinase